MYIYDAYMLRSEQKKKRVARIVKRDLFFTVRLRDIELRLETFTVDNRYCSTVIHIVFIRNDGYVKFNFKV